MTDFASRSSQDYNHFYTNPQVAMSQYTTGNGVNFYYNNGQIQYPTVSGPYPTYSSPYIPSQHASSPSMYLPAQSSMPVQYQLSSNRLSTVPSQSRNHLQSALYGSTRLPQGLQLPLPRSNLGHEMQNMMDTEPQESFNEATRLSEPVVPPLEGYPDVKEFDELMKQYVEGLSPKKQDKALIHARRAANIKTVLIDKKTTAVESAQFRFWVKKMFELLPHDPKIPDRKKKICHESKPVAVREKLFKILTRAHKQCQHGGRDKTSAQVRRVYSWVPKELISRFVKLCPTCQIRRGTNRTSPPGSDRSPEAYLDTQSPESMSPSASRRESNATSRGSCSVYSPLPLAGCTSTFQQQNRWMTAAQPSNGGADVPIDSPSHGLSSYRSRHSDSGGTQHALNAGTTLSSTHGAFSSINDMNHSSPTAYGSQHLHTIPHHVYGMKEEPHFS